MVVVLPLPVEVNPSGLLVRVHVPVAGSPLRGTVPVATSQSGWVIVPTPGAIGVGGCALMMIDPLGSDSQPAAEVTV